MDPTATPAAPPDDREGLVATAPAGGRLASLDAFRGLTVAGMILVNSGSGESYAPLHHAPWDGWTPTDLVFPSFLFIVGASIAYALPKRLAAPGGARSTFFKILRRSLIIFGLGLFLNAFPDLDRWATLRIPGVLQRIALCYLATALIFMVTGVRGQLLAVVGLLAGYWALLRYVPVPGPGPGPGDLSRGHDLGSYLDRLLLAGHIYKPDYDPEGLLSTLPAIATTLIGVLAGHWLRSGRPRAEVASGLMLAGVAGWVAGSAWGLGYPINKALWTGSFVVLAAGIAAMVLGACYFLIDVKGYRRWAWPFGSFGRNPIVAYTLAAFAGRFAGRPYFTAPGGGKIGLHELYHDHFLALHLGPADAALAWSLSLVIACFLVVALMDALGWHVRA